jgi:hypothetical protein
VVEGTGRPRNQHNPVVGVLQVLGARPLGPLCGGICERITPIRHRQGAHHRRRLLNCKRTMPGFVGSDVLRLGCSEGCSRPRRWRTWASPGPPIDLPSRPVFNLNVVSIVVGSRGFDSMNAHRMVFGGGVGPVVGGVASSFSVFGRQYSQRSMTETSRTDVSAQRLKGRPRQLDLAAPATSSGDAHGERVGEGYSPCDERIEVDLVGIVEDNREEKPIRLGLEQYECHWNVEPF